MRQQQQQQQAIKSLSDLDLEIQNTLTSFADFSGRVFLGYSLESSPLNSSRSLAISARFLTKGQKITSCSEGEEEISGVIQLLNQFLTFSVYEYGEEGQIAFTFMSRISSQEGADL